VTGVDIAESSPPRIFIWARNLFTDSGSSYGDWGAIEDGKLQSFELRQAGEDKVKSRESALLCGMEENPPPSWVNKYGRSDLQTDPLSAKDGGLARENNCQTMEKRGTKDDADRSGRARGGGAQDQDARAKTE
jgi:hypothetical protein